MIITAYAHRKHLTFNVIRDGLGVEKTVRISWLCRAVKRLALVRKEVSSSISGKEIPSSP